MEIHIRPMRNSDEIPYDLLLLADPSRAQVDTYIHSGRCYLAYHDDEVIGEFVLLQTRPATIEIMNVAVKETHQGRGVGKQLIARAIEEARSLEARTIEIGTGNSGIHQLKLYQKCGFRIYAVDIDFFVRHYEEAIVEDGIPCRDMIRLRIEL